jgi:hypothetical protein
LLPTTIGKGSIVKNSPFEQTDRIEGRRKLPPKAETSKVFLTKQQISIGTADIGAAVTATAELNVEQTGAEGVGVTHAAYSASGAQRSGNSSQVILNPDNTRTRQPPTTTNSS